MFEDMERFDPIKGLSQRVLTMLESAHRRGMLPELMIDEESAPQPGEKVRVWYVPESYEEFKRQDYKLKSELVEVVQWYRFDEKKPVVALIYKTQSRPEVLYGDDWSIYEFMALRKARELCDERTDELMREIHQIAQRSRALGDQLQQAEEKHVELLKAIESKTEHILIVHNPHPDQDTLRSVDYARKRGLELADFARVRFHVGSVGDLDGSVCNKATGMVVIESDVGEGDERVPAISEAVAMLADEFLQKGKRVWAWRDSQGREATGTRTTTVQLDVGGDGPGDEKPEDIEIFQLDLK